ncbi:MAG: ThiF family adenylyltransferase [Eubacteriales bacterium]|nr:ThiF family adenylyltransferase [Eubacteriales bacterium]
MKDNENIYQRTEHLFGAEGLAKIRQAHILLLGIGGVGGAVFEALVRAGVAKLTVVDGDKFSKSNLNRQLLANRETIGRSKVAVAKEVAASINPEVEIEAIEQRLDRSSAQHLIAERAADFDILIDCIDDIEAKAAAVKAATNTPLTILVSGGAGNRTRPEGVRIDYLENAFSDPFLKKFRKSLGDYPKGRIYTIFSPFKAMPKRDGMIASSPYLPNILGFTLAGLALEILTDIRN